MSAQVAKTPRRGGGNPPSTPTETQLVTLPYELILEIIEHCAKLDDKSLSSLSGVDKFLRAMCIPFLFRKIRVKCSEDELLRHMSAIEDNQSILQSVRVLDICTEGPYRSPEPDFKSEWDSNWRYLLPRISHACSKSTPKRLAHFLQKMASLEDLCIDIRYGSRSLLVPLRRAFLKHHMTFPGVKALTWTSGTMPKFIPSVFPNLRALGIDLKKNPRSCPELSRVGRRLQHLHTLELYKGAWNYDILDQLPGLFPSISCLILGGGRDGYEGIPDSFRSFQTLKTLSITTQVSGGRVPRAARPDRGNTNLDKDWDTSEQSRTVNSMLAICPQLETVYLMSRNYRSIKCTRKESIHRRYPDWVDINANFDCGEYGWPIF